jgi:hypothetical protein
MGNPYSFRDVTRSYEWLGHREWTEVNALHPDYRRDDRAWNRQHQTYPVVAYVRSAPDVLRFVQQYAGERMVCYGLNPRPQAFTNQYGRPRSAKEEDILVGQSLVLDIDLEGVVSSSRLASLTRFLRVADEYFVSLGLRRPVRASSGNRGSHLLFAYPPMLVADCPDLHHRLRSFRASFVDAVQHDLTRLEARVDTGTLALRAAVKAYGTGKPGGTLSRFYGKERVEDHALHKCLLALPARPPTTITDIVVTPGTVLPAWFTALLSSDDRVRDLWHGRGKIAGDTSGSGYDYTLVRTLVERGYTHRDDLATLLVLRVGGGVTHGKGRAYVVRTLAKALH